MATPRKAQKAAPADQPLTREIRSAIADSGLTAHALSKLSGVDEMGIRRFLSRERSLSLASADRLALALGLHLIRKSRPKARTKADA